MWRTFSAALTGGGTWRSLASGSPMAGGLTGWMTTCNGGVGLVGRLEAPDCRFAIRTRNIQEENRFVQSALLTAYTVGSGKEYCTPKLWQPAGSARLYSAGTEVNTDKFLWRTLSGFQHAAAKVDP